MSFTRSLKRKEKVCDHKVNLLPDSPEACSKQAKLHTSIQTQLTLYTDSAQHRQASRLGCESTLCASRLATGGDRKQAKLHKRLSQKSECTTHVRSI